MFSDNGTNFQGADNRCSVTMVPVSKVLTTRYWILACYWKQKNNQSGFKCIHPIIYEWKFTPPFGGLCEDIIKSMKTFVCTSGDQIVTKRIILYVNTKRVLFQLLSSFILAERPQWSHILVSWPFSHWRTSYENPSNDVINPLKTKHRPLYLKTQFVPRCKHF